MLEFRCAFMHAFSLVLVAMLAHEHARTLLAMAQKVVVYIGASHMLKQRLEAARKELGISATLASAGNTRITSMCELVSTALLNERSLSKMVTDDRALFSKPDVVKIIEDTSFWRVCCAFPTPPFISFARVRRHAYSETLADLSWVKVYCSPCLLSLISISFMRYTAGAHRPGQASGAVPAGAVGPPREADAACGLHAVLPVPGAGAAAAARQPAGRCVSNLVNAPLLMLLHL